MKLTTPREVIIYEQGRHDEAKEPSEAFPASPCSAPRGRVEGDWWLTPISECCGYLMKWHSDDMDCCTLEEWHGNPNDGEPDKLTCMKCGSVCWQNANVQRPADATPDPVE